MFGQAGGSKGKMLEKLLELFSQMPDKEDLKDGGIDEAKEGEPPLKGAEISMISAHPVKPGAIGHLDLKKKGAF